MNAKFFQAVWGWTLALGLSALAHGQEAQTAKQKQQAGDGATTTQGVSELSTQLGQLQYERTLGVLLADKLVSSNDLGVDLAEIHPALRAQLNLAEGTGLVVTAVPADSAGAKAGLQPHDVLVNIGATSVGNLAQVAEALQKAPGESADKTAMLGVIRQGKAMTLKAVPKSPLIAELVLSDAPVTVWSKLRDANAEPRYRIGVVLSEADETLRAQVGLAAGEGLIVTEVFPDTPAAKAGIQPHDVLVILDGKRLSTVDGVNAQIQEIKEQEVGLKLLRGGKEVTLKIAPQKEVAEQAYLEATRAWTIWNPGACPGQARALSCTSCHRDPFPEWKADVDYHKRLGIWLDKTRTAPEGSPQEQVHQLKQQLAKMQETLSTLEASLAASAAKEENEPKPEEKK